jgi:hypothetical protein
LTPIRATELVVVLGEYAVGAGRWWEIDVPIKYVRKDRTPTIERGGNFDSETDDHHAGLR